MKRKLIALCLLPILAFGQWALDFDEDFAADSAAAAWSPLDLGPSTWFRCDGDAVDSGSSKSNAVWYYGASYTNGVNGSAWNLEGVNTFLFAGYIEHAEETFAFWILPRNITSVRVAVSTRSVISGDSVPGVGVAFENTADKQELYANYGYRSPIAYTKNVWRHVVVTYSGGEWAVHTNGVLAASYSGGRTEGKTLINIGANGSLSTMINAAIDDLMKFDRVLDQSEIVRLYNWRQ